MSGAQLRDLAARLPKAAGPAAVLPTLPGYLPRRQLVPESARYLFGPQAYAALDIDVSPSLIDFSKSPELLWAKVQGSERGESAELLLIDYPTPHIAMDKLPAFEKLAPPTGETNSTQISEVKRSGPILALVRGNILRGEAARILDGINYDANVTWDEPAPDNRGNIGGVIVTAITLAAILFVMSVGAGAVFGFGRYLLPRFRAKKGGEAHDDGGVIRLRLHS
jgi:hypothetical protein